MSLSLLRSRALAGLDAPEVQVEVHLANGLPSFSIVGLPETEVKESRDRVRAAILNSRFEFPSRRVTVNLAPADLPKESGRFDLPIALGILAASGQIPGNHLDDYEYAGELSLSGSLRPVRGALAMAYALNRNGAQRSRGFILPTQSADEAGLVTDTDILPANDLLEVCAHLSGAMRLQKLAVTAPTASVQYPDLADVRGQPVARRALEIAAAGGHSLLLIGPPGTGKSMLASRFPGILPPMTEAEAMETAALQSLAGRFTMRAWRMRPFRSPHHTASAVALVGGGSVPRPGEISLAHHGVLFLDELPEFDRRVLEVLREPLETGRIAISRAARQAEFPARFQLIAAMNPCPCGWFGNAQRECRCSTDAVMRYQGRISGPLLDRIDMQVEVGALDPSAMRGPVDGENSAVVAKRVARARERQQARQPGSNATLEAAQIEGVCPADNDALTLLQAAMARLNWSARAYFRVLKVARSIADLADADRISKAHVAEAIGYRRGLLRGD